MKYLIVGLGNIGAKYDNTRHNIGFEVVDYLADAFGVSWSTQKLGDVTEFRHKGRTFVLLKPSTYMNLSGKSVRYWMQAKKIDKANLLVVLDDLHLPFGKLRLRGKGSDAGHNGLKDIDRMTQGNNYARLRFGIGNEFPKGRQAEFVLSAWSDAESDKMAEFKEKASKAILAFGTIGLSRAMNLVNTK